MSKIIKKLKLTNKTMDVYRLNSDRTAYNLLLEAIPMRYEGLEPVETALRIVDNIREQVMLISSDLMVDPIDIAVADYVYIREDDKKFVITGIQRHDERNLAYFEILMRQLESPLHKTAEILTLTETQSNYDPLLHTWDGKKDEVSTPISILATTEPLRNRGEHAVDEAGGRLEEGLFLFIVDLPYHPKLTDRLRYNGDEYYIRRIEDLIFQTEVKVEKILPNGKQFE